MWTREMWRTDSHTRTRLKGDVAVKNVINCTLQREESLSHTTGRLHTTSVVEQTYQEVLQLHTVEGEMPNFTGPQGRHLQEQFTHRVQQNVKSVVREEQQKQLASHVKGLTLQGHTLALAAAEKEDAVWKGYMFDLKAGTLKFLLNATIDTLPTAANLRRWKKSPSDLCKLCKGRQTTRHVLNGCSVALNTKRFTGRHDTILSCVLSCMDKTRFKVYSDLVGHQAAGGGTIPPEICVTNLRPDVVVLEEESKTIHIFELTMPGEHRIDESNRLKSNKYNHFVTDCAPYTCTLTCFEISSKGFISTRNHQNLKTLHSYMTPDTKLSTLKKNISALAIYTSYHIWLCRSDPLFTIPPFLPPPFTDGRSRSRGPGL